MSQDLLFFVGVLLMFFAVWVGAGGPNNPGAFSGPFLNGPGTSTPAYSSSTAWRSASGDASPYRGQVMLSRTTSGAMADDERREYVIIQTSITNQEEVSLAGWKVRSSVTGNEAALPQATALPKAGRVNETAPLVLAPGEEAIVVTGRSPIGTSFRENMCTGYFEEHQDFTPSLSLSCPTPYQEFMDADDDECAAQARTLRQCTTEARTISRACEDEIEERLSYGGCVAAHKDDAGFARSTWRLFLGEREELWKRSRETILLLDADNKVVDALSY